MRRRLKWEEGWNENKVGMRRSLGWGEGWDEEMVEIKKSLGWEGLRFNEKDIVRIWLGLEGHG